MASTINASTSSGIVQTADTSGILQLQTAGTTAITINASQLVGVGTSSPTNSISISNPSVYAALSFDWTGDSTAKARIGANHSTGEVQYWATTNYFPTFYAGNSERMRIDSSGNVCVGTTSASIYGTNTIAMVGTDGAAFKVTGGTGNDTIYSWNNATSGNNGFVRFLTEASATFRGEITYNRGSSVVSYGTSSDVRLKENIVDASSSLEKINSIKIRSFDWKETGIHTDFGVIAQELFAVAPEAVIEGDDKDVIEKTWQVDTSVLVPAMIKAIQEQQTIINDLKARVTALEGAK